LNIFEPSTNREERAPDSEATQPGPDLLDYLFIIVKYKKIIAAITLVAAVGAVIYSLSLPNIYTAKTLILPGEDDKGIMGAMMAQMGGLGGLAGDALGGKSKSDLYVTMLKSDTVRDAIIDRFKLMQLYEAKYRAYAHQALGGRTKIITGKKDGVITIAVDDKDPKLAADLANAYVAELGKLAVGLNALGAGNNRAFLEKRIASTRVDLAKAEDALKEFQSRNKAIAVTEQASATIGGIAQLRAQLAIQEVQLATLQRQFTDSSQEVKSAKTGVGNLRAQIAAMEGQGEGSSSIPSVGSVPGLGQQYMRLMREFKIQEAVLEMLVKQFEVASLSETKDVSPLQVIQIAKVPELKSKPSRAKICVVITFLAFFATVVVVCLKESVAHMKEDELARWKALGAGLLFRRKSDDGAR